ncbi:5-oxoprolinase subunit PxpA [Azospirillum sp. RWY-5-1]|uniref:5-oxoprolinase subunit A n=1 Tax=Azospirillum oleiclasticum TaxID=2735135 RepID=A0ABX2TMF6_9PROT|nr:5-oxoprolinase subunit PxpA [Azospirillum oleiclasticum]NYZ17008.1 5-oxoprolinase subunit PxpA [Azospirillum oleiclasticum]NYZ24548.1 5-oxoprolinase subunit PxpA [Azospirillum oleiclasticum]
MTAIINLNSDLGEAFGAWPMGDDEAMLDIVASANIACGYHAGDPLVMTRTVRSALAKGVSLGAHPAYPDLQGFGRRPMRLSDAEAEAMVAYQIGALCGIAAANGGTVTHVKAHGALYNAAATDESLALAIGRAIRGVDRNLIYLALAGSVMAKAGRSLGLTVAEEAFADRNYTDDGTLVPRTRPDAMIHVPDQAADNVLRMVQDGVVVSTTGKRVPVTVHSVCVHGDEPSAVALATTLRKRLEADRVRIVTLPDMMNGR